MNTRILPPAVTALVAMAITSAPVGSPSLPVAGASPRIVDLATVIVRPTAEDAAYYQAHKIIDLAAVIVYPVAGDQALFLAGKAPRASLACRC